MRKLDDSVLLILFTCLSLPLCFVRLSDPSSFQRVYRHLPLHRRLRQAIPTCPPRPLQCQKGSRPSSPPLTAMRGPANHPKRPKKTNTPSFLLLLQLLERHRPIWTMLRPWQSWRAPNANATTRKPTPHPPRIRLESAVCASSITMTLNRHSSNRNSSNTL